MFDTMAITPGLKVNGLIMHVVCMCDFVLLFETNSLMFEVENLKQKLMCQNWLKC